MGFSKLDLLRYMRSTNLGVISTVSSQGTPEAALVGIATADDHRVIFDTTTATRKHANLMHSPAVALVTAGNWFMKVTGYLLATALVLTGTVATALGQDNTGGQEYDPEHGVARISVIAGDVSIQRGDSDERSAAAVNAPLVSGDTSVPGTLASFAGS